MATYSHGAPTALSSWNFVSAYSLHRPDVDPKLALRYGSQSLVGLLAYVGNEKPTESIEYKHHEEDWIMPKVLATAPGGAAGANVTFTLAASALSTINYNNSPYNATTTEQVIPVRAGDTLLIKPAAGTVSASTMIWAWVASVNATAGTFVATPILATESIPVIAAADEIVIYGNLFGEGSGQPEGRSSTTSEYTNNLMISKETYEITGTEKDMILWVDVPGPGGTSSPYYAIKGEGDTLKRFLNYLELENLLSKKITNITNISNVQAALGTPIRATEGLIPFILTNGTTRNYSAITGYTLADNKTTIKELDKLKGSKENLFMCGIDLSMQIDDEFGDRYKNGAISYGSFNFGDDIRVALEFDSWSQGGYTFHKRTYDAFNSLQTLGASGFNFSKEGIMIPLENQSVMVNRERMTVPSLRIRYIEGRKLITEPVNRIRTDGVDKYVVRYISEMGFEGTSPNKFVYIKLQ